MRSIDKETADLLEEVGYSFGWAEFQGIKYPLHIPNLYEVQEWLRETKNLFLQVLYDTEAQEWYYYTYDYYQCKTLPGANYNFYEEALLEGIKHSTRHLKLKKLKDEQ